MKKPISLFSGDFKRAAEHSFVVATSDSCLCSRLTCEYSNGRDAFVGSAAPFCRITCEPGFIQRECWGIHIMADLYLRFKLRVEVGDHVLQTCI